MVNRDSKEARMIITSGGIEPSNTKVFDSGLSFDPAVSHNDYIAALEEEKRNIDEALSVYIHLPFCPSRCLSCDHQTTVSHDHKQIDHYLDTLEIEVQLVTDHLGRNRRLQQLHLGGGTPNYLSELQLVRLVDILDKYFVIDAQTESSLEANAHRASVSQLSLLHGLGFRNLNLELRDLDPTVQQALGRHQSLPVVRDVVETARQIGFTTVATDLVYGLPMQSASSVQKTVEELLALEPDRVSCFTYSRRANHFQHQRAIDSRQMPSIADKVAIFSRIVEKFCQSDYEWIGLDCFARSQDRISEAHRTGALHRNWIGYTEQTGRGVVGLGSSSMTDLSSICVQNHADIEQWRESLERGELPMSAAARLSPNLRARRHALSDLMCNLHLDDDQHTLLDPKQEYPALQALKEDGLVEIEGDKLTMTEAGRFTLHQAWGDSSPVYRWRSFA
ncbi:radical SAM protein [Congregibacter litoralis]|uniref:Coproporphyrinogen-III oxidase n=1 Tax=Congregibacter litoralis KT71 TaxID=314285 RepID=A4ACQ2_9GAMM|nr:radical SAM protein [Congregibacter litoralis]EAQ96266.1 Coproporphyrinogen III oxidase [Congregibacter litoralis KT71]